ncbi:RPA-interacting protein A [Wolffia australiana]
MDDCRNPRRRPKSVSFANLKEKLRENCLRRVQEDRVNLLWRTRLSENQEHSPKDTVETAFKGIVASELSKIKNSTLSDQSEIVASDCNDPIWEYSHLQGDFSLLESNYEELLIEMERLLYDDMKEELTRKELEVYEEEDEYLAKAVFEHMNLTDGKVEERETIWCPVCKRGELGETHHLIFCSSCSLRLDLSDVKVSLDFLRHRLCQVHEEHLERGCKATPSFVVESGFNLAVLYVRCPACGTFDVVV